jgi:hypothetical protein
MRIVLRNLMQPPPPLDNGKDGAETCRGENELATKIK